MKRASITASLSKQLERHEGLRLDAYLDTKGILTVGVGHNCAAKPVLGISFPGDVISRDQAMELLAQDMAEAEYEVIKRWDWTSRLNDARYGVLVNMAFNMGGATLATFVRTMGCIERGQFETAAKNMLDSLWASQVGKDEPGSPAALRRGRPGRAWELSEQMRIGAWQGI